MSSTGQAAGGFYRIMTSLATSGKSSRLARARGLVNVETKEFHVQRLKGCDSGSHELYNVGETVSPRHSGANG
jgi:hypothetical protein